MNLRRRTGIGYLSECRDRTGATACRKGSGLVLHEPVGQINCRIEGYIMAVANPTTERPILSEMRKRNRDRR
ncbi:heme A synthase, partial [Rhizobium johnstonii]